MTTLIDGTWIGEMKPLKIGWVRIQGVPTKNAQLVGNDITRREEQETVCTGMTYIQT